MRPFVTGAYFLTALPAAIVGAAYAVLFVMVPISRDSGVFMYSGRLLLEGSAPYSGSWDHKGPALYVLNAIGLALEGGDPRGVILLEGVVLTISLFYAVRCWTALTSPRMATILGVGYAVTFLMLFEGGNFTETWLSAFSLVALSRLARTMSNPSANTDLYWTALAIGIAGGVAATTRPNNGVGLLAAAVALVISAKAVRGRTALVILVGGILVLVPTLFLVVLRHSTGLMWNEYVQYNLLYSDSSSVERVAALVHFLVRIAGTPIFLLGFIALLQVARERERALFLPWPWRAMCVIATVDFLSQGLSGRTYDHYAIVALPSIAVAAVTGFHLCQSHGIYGWTAFISRRTSNLYIALVSLIVVSSVFAAGKSMQVLIAHSLNNDGSALASVTKGILGATSNGDQVLVHGAETRFLVSSDRHSPTDRTYIAFMMNDVVAVNDYVQDTFERPPRLIVRAPYMPRFEKRICHQSHCTDADRGLQRFNRWVVAHYQITQVTNGFELWHRKDSLS